VVAAPATMAARFRGAAELAARPRGFGDLLCDRDSLQATRPPRRRLEASGAAVQSTGDRQAGADHRCAVWRWTQPPVTGEPHDVIERSRQWRAGSRSRLPSGINVPAARSWRGVRATETSLLPAQAAHLLCPGESTAAACRSPISESIRMCWRRSGRRRSRTFRRPGVKHSRCADRRLTNTPAPRHRGFGDIAATGAARMSGAGRCGRRRSGHAGLAPGRLAVNAAALTAVMVRPIDTVVEFAELLADSASTPV